LKIKRSVCVQQSGQHPGTKKARATRYKNARALECTPVANPLEYVSQVVGW
jgi:hypothetical protein